MKPNGGCKAHAVVNNISRNEHNPTVGSKDPMRGSRRVKGHFRGIRMSISRNRSNNGVEDDETDRTMSLYI
ncbi:hypothetical protein GQ457_13G007850 [Hibiscus cannabinus]